MKKCYWVSTEITFGPSYKVLLLCDSCHQNMMINMIGTVLAKAATCFRFLLKSGQNKNYRFCPDFWQRQDLTQAANTLLHCQWFIPPLGILFDLGIYIFLEFKMLTLKWCIWTLPKMPWSFIVSINFLFSNPHDLDNSFWICDIFKDSRPVCKYLKIGKLSSPWHCVFWIVTFSVVQSGFIEKSRTQRKHSAHALQLPGGKALKAWYLRICEVLHAII